MDSDAVTWTQEATMTTTMLPTSVLVRTSRAEIVNQPALVQALEEGAT